MRVKELEMVAVVPVKDTIRKEVDDAYRLWAKGNYEFRRKVHRKRWRGREWPTETVLCLMLLGYINPSNLFSFNKMRVFPTTSERIEKTYSCFKFTRLHIS